MGKVLETVMPRRFTVEEYHRMAETGILGPDERVELIRGVIREMSPKNRAHVVAATIIYNLVRDALRGQASVYLEAPLVAKGIASEPEPDVTVCSNPDTTAYGTDRTKPLLVVEVSESSLEYDLGEKSDLYASAEVPEYWVVNLADRVLVVFREPTDGRYQVRSTLEGEDRVTPTAWPGLSFPVSALFPPESSEPL
jgi:Uma2 family endonuclease